MKPYSGEPWSVFVDSKVTPLVIFLTAGELGIPQNSTISPLEMKEIRKSEAKQAMNFLQATVTFLDFADLHLSFIPIQQMVSSVLPLIREFETDALFSFHPQEITTAFDHPDHTVAGNVARFVGTAADVSHFMPQYTALNKRPELYLWTTQNSSHCHTFSLKEQSRQNRNEYLMRYYPSQFSSIIQYKWISIFDRITYDKQNLHQERYCKVR